MSFEIVKQIICDRCQYREPNKNNCLEKWIFTNDTKTGTEYHFCADYCYTYYSNCYGVNFDDKRYVGSKSKEFQKILEEIK